MIRAGGHLQRLSLHRYAFALASTSYRQTCLPIQAGTNEGLDPIRRELRSRFTKASRGVDETPPEEAKAA